MTQREIVIGQLTINMPDLNLNDLPCEHANTFKLTGFDFDLSLLLIISFKKIC